MLLNGFRKDRRGAVAPMFALAIIPIFGFVGAAVDYTRGNSLKAAIQSALDATTLGMAKLAPTLTQSELQTKTAAYFNAIFTRPEAKNLVITPTYTTSGGSQLTIAVSSTVDTAFMRLMGVSSLNVGASSTVKWGNSRLRVALALDNTGSMASAGKIDALKSASKSLLKQLKDAATSNGDVYVSIIPFNKDVNVGKSNYSQTWVNFQDHAFYEGWDKVNGTCSNSNFSAYADCIDKNKTWTPNSHTTWNGCVTDRDQNYDTTNTTPTSSATRFPAEQYDKCPAELMGLSYDWTALNSKIDDMTPDGNTNQTIGLQWGFQSLTASPFTIPAKDANYTYNEVIILLTDGLNTQNRFTTTQSAIDTRTAKVCDNIKTVGIAIYALQVNTGGDPTSTMLQQCASDSSKFFLVTSSSQITTIFSQIGTNLSKLRIAK
jgi:Flp pilus assembly protein TadG